MKVSLDWLNEYVDLSGQSVEDISHALTMAGFEVEGIDRAGLEPMENVVVGEVMSHEQHPNADRLSLCQVDVGDGTVRSIVCGAKNFRDKDRVIVALPGAVLPGNFKIKKSKLRGVVSEGMLCSEKELGIGDDHEGIAILVSRPELGVSVNEIYPEPDTVFDLEITPNRPDALCHLGIARELSAWFKLPLRYPKLSVNPAKAEKGQLIDSLECPESQLCPHYRGYSVRGVSVDPSPGWLKRRLSAIGLRPINNIVDATNYILHETGQPLHAFDVAKIRGPKIVVRSAVEGENITTLDDKKRRLSPENLVIADAEKPLVVAGVMGSVDAEVDESTQDIFLESAYFNPVSIRRTSKQLGLSTDSSYRFERGVDPSGAEYAALRCLDLIQQLAGGQLLGPPLVEGEATMLEREVALSPSWVRRQLGFEVPDSEIKDSLTRLELRVHETTDNEGDPLFRVKIPSFRADLYRPIDLVEEIIRIYGSDRIPEGTVRATVTLREDDSIPVYQRKATELLVGKGFQEAVNYSLRREGELQGWTEDMRTEQLALANPLASDASHLRPSLLPGLLDCLQINQARHNEVERLFECGRVFREYEGKVYEFLSVGFVLARDARASWKSSSQPDYYFASRMVSDLLGLCGIGVNHWDFKAMSGNSPWQPGHAASIGSLADGYEARFGILSLELTTNWDLGNPVVAGALYLLPEFLQKPSGRKTYRSFSLQPPAIRDVAIVVPESMPSGEIEKLIIKKAEEHLGEAMDLESVRLFDRYAGKGIAENHVSLAYQLTFRNPERTLNDKEVNAAFQNILTSLDAHNNVEVRR